MVTNTGNIIIKLTSTRKHDNWQDQYLMDVHSSRCQTSTSRWTNFGNGAWLMEGVIIPGGIGYYYLKNRQTNMYAIFVDQKDDNACPMKGTTKKPGEEGWFKFIPMKVSE